MISPRQHSDAKGDCHRRFTLIELLVSMTILSIIIVILLYITQSAQTNWTNQEGRSKIYQNSRVVFDVLDRDFRSIQTSDISGQEVGFHIFDHDSEDVSKRNLICFVATIEPDVGATSRMVEVSYRFHRDPAAANTRWILERQQVSNNDPAGNWDFFDTPANWHENDNVDPGPPEVPPPPWETVAAGIEEFTLEVYAPGGSSPLAPGDYTTRPERVMVHLSIFDEALTGSLAGLPDTQAAKIRLKTQRSFTKIIYLGNLNK